MNKYFKKVEILEVDDSELVVKITIDLKKFVGDFLGLCNNLRELIIKMADNLRKNESEPIWNDGKIHWPEKE